MKKLFHIQFSLPTVLFALVIVLSVSFSPLALYAQESFSISPTIHAVEAGGRWNKATTWEEGVVPDVTDIVEINGRVTLESDIVVAGIKISPGATLSARNYTTYSIEIKGDIQNDGIVDRYIRPTISGSIQTTGTWVNSIKLGGTEAKILEGSLPVSIILLNDITVSNTNVNMLGLSTNGFTFNFNNPDSTITLKEISGDFVTNGNLVFSDPDDIRTTQTHNIRAGSVTFTKLHRVSDNLGINANTITVEPEASFTPRTSFATYSLTLDGDFVNKGNLNRYINIIAEGSVDNQGSWESALFLSGTDIRSLNGSFPMSISLESDIIVSNTEGVKLAYLNTQGYRFHFEVDESPLYIHTLDGGLSTNGILFFGFDGVLTTSHSGDITAAYIVINSDHTLRSSTLHTELLFINEGAGISPKNASLTEILTINADVVNKGTLHTKIEPHIYGSVENTGTWLSSSTHLSWPEESTDSYQFVVSNTEIDIETIPPHSLLENNISYDYRTSPGTSFSTILNSSDVLFWRAKADTGVWSEIFTLNQSINLPDVLKEQGYFTINPIPDTPQFEQISILISADITYNGVVDVFLNDSGGSTFLGQTTLTAGGGILKNISLDENPGTYTIMVSDDKRGGESPPFAIIQARDIVDYFSLHHASHFEYGTTNVLVDIIAQEHDYAGILMLSIEGIDVTPSDTALIDGSGQVDISFIAEPGTYTLEVQEGYRLGTSTFTINEQQRSSGGSSRRGGDNPFDTSDSEEAEDSQEEQSEVPEAEEVFEEEVEEPEIEYLIDINNECIQIQSEKVLATWNNNNKPPVTALQQFLFDYGYNPKGIDGYFGPGTKSALISFQSNNGLGTDGIFGTGTAGYIDENCENIHVNSGEEIAEELEEEIPEEEETWVEGVVDDIGEWFNNQWNNIMNALGLGEGDKEEVFGDIVKEIVLDDEINIISYESVNFINKNLLFEEKFLSSVIKIDQFATDTGIIIYVTGTGIRNPDIPLEDTVVEPSSVSNHLVGHAIDINLIASDGSFCNSSCLELGNYHQSIANFLGLVENDSVLRWGGNFTKVDVVHIDDGLNVVNMEEWLTLFRKINYD